MSALTVHIEIGHEASLRSKITPEGFTHDWEVYVRGANNADIHHYVEKVVFYLHETFPKPKRVVKEPPYSVKTSGYAGFNLPIEIYLRNSQEPRKIKFNYDLQLQPNGPTIHKVQKEKYVFISPSDEFRSKLLKGGAVVGSGSSHETSEIRSNIDEKNQMTSKPKLSTSSLDILKKQKYRPDTSNSFQNLFGTPITKTNKQEIVKPKEQPQSKNPSSLKPEKEKSKNKSIYKDKEKIKSSNDSKTKDDRKNKDKPKDHERNKEKKREKSRDRSVTPKEKERKEEKKSKKEKREHKENKHRDKEKNDHKEHKSRTSKENHLSKEIKEPSPLPQPKTERKEKLKEILKDEEKQRSEEKSKHKYKKKDKERKEKKEEKSHKSSQEKKSDKPVSLVKENGKELPPDKSSLFDSPKSEEQQISKKLTPPNIAPLGDDSSCSSRNSSRESSPIPQPPPPPPPPPQSEQIEIKKTHDLLIEQKKIKDEIKEKKKEKREKKRDKKLEKEHEKKRKRKLETEMDVPPPEKKERDEDLANNNSDDERKVSSSEDATVVPPQNENEDYMGMLRDLQHKIMGLRDNSDLQKVVQLIAETGRYEVSAHTFDFDLCLLEPSTVRQLQDFFSTIS